MVYRDYQGLQIRLTDERLRHILRRHSYLVGMERVIPETLETPEEVRRSTSDPSHVILYYRWYTGIRIGDKYMCVVVRMLEEDAFVITAYMTDRIKQGEAIWSTRR